jgi:hypothetical protein
VKAFSAFVDAARATMEWLSGAIVAEALATTQKRQTVAGHRI